MLSLFHYFFAFLEFYLNNIVAETCNSRNGYVFDYRNRSHFYVFVLQSPRKTDFFFKLNL